MQFDHSNDSKQQLKTQQTCYQTFIHNIRKIAIKSLDFAKITFLPPDGKLFDSTQMTPQNNKSTIKI